jgi:hypothetical protein
MREVKAICILLCVLLTGCNEICFGSYCVGGSSGSGSGSGPVDSPGTFSYYDQLSFTSSDLSSFCFNSSDASCVDQIPDDFGTPLTTAGWQLDNGIVDGYVNGAWTTQETSASEVTGDTSNIILISSHGSVGNGQSVICLRDCNGAAYGGTVAISTVGVPNGWQGPNWFLVNACEVVQANVGWESKFGGSLHGILGFSQDNQGLEDPGLSTLSTLIESHDNAIDAWEKAVAADQLTQYIGMLVPAKNASDSLEANGGPHFGYNGDTNPIYYYCCNSNNAVTTASPSMVSSATSAYTLVPESVSESQLLTKYDASSTTYKMQEPNTNEHVFASQGVIVQHYLASGGIVVSMQSTGNAYGVSPAAALSYAQSWLENTGGGLPSDAVLTFAGIETMSASPTTLWGSVPYPNVKEYVFIWQHGTSGVLSGDKIQVNVDDAGTFTYSCHVLRGSVESCAYSGPWVSSPHVAAYVRIWRSLGTPAIAPTPAPGAAIPASYLGLRRVGTALCASNMVSTSNVATPCAVYGATGTRYFVDASTGQARGSASFP